jgi:hypothetical protein
METTALPTEFVKALLSYLVTRPYGEVAGAVQTIQSYLPKQEAPEQPAATAA